MSADDSFTSVARKVRKPSSKPKDVAEPVWVFKVDWDWVNPTEEEMDESAEELAAVARKPSLKFYKEMRSQREAFEWGQGRKWYHAYSPSRDMIGTKDENGTYIEIEGTKRYRKRLRNDSTVPIDILKEWTKSRKADKKKASTTEDATAEVSPFVRDLLSVEGVTEPMADAIVAWFSEAAMLAAYLHETPNKEAIKAFGAIKYSVEDEKKQRYIGPGIVKRLREKFQPVEEQFDAMDESHPHTDEAAQEQPVLPTDAGCKICQTISTMYQEQYTQAPLFQLSCAKHMEKINGGQPYIKSTIGRANGIVPLARFASAHVQLEDLSEKPAEKVPEENSEDEGGADEDEDEGDETPQEFVERIMSRKPTEEDNIKMVMDNSTVSREEAVVALKKHTNVVDAILSLTPDVPVDHKVNLRPAVILLAHHLHPEDETIVEELKKCGIKPTVARYDEADISTVMSQAECSREKAMEALKQNGNIVDAILALVP